MEFSKNFSDFTDFGSILLRQRALKIDFLKENLSLFSTFIFRHISFRKEVKIGNTCCVLQIRLGVHYLRYFCYYFSDDILSLISVTMIRVVNETNN